MTLLLLIIKFICPKSHIQLPRKYHLGVVIIVQNFLSLMLKFLTTKKVKFKASQDIQHNIKLLLLAFVGLLTLIIGFLTLQHYKLVTQNVMVVKFI
jgi:hypothetical protein